MAQKEYSTKGRKFQHLTKEKRAQIEILLRRKVSKSQIAKEVGIARSTLYNELARGRVAQLDSELREHSRYFWDAGQRVYEEHRQNSRPPLKMAKAYEFIAYAEQQMLEEKLAPETICGIVRRNGMFEKTVCAKTLYNYIDQCLLKVRNIDLLLKVKRKTNVHRNRQHKHLYGMSIEERPQAANNREEFGHWEIDTVVGNRDSAAVLLTLDERTLNFRHMFKIPSRSTSAVEQGIKQLQAIYQKSNATIRGYVLWGMANRSREPLSLVEGSSTARAKPPGGSENALPPGPPLVPVRFGNAAALRGGSDYGRADFLCGTITHQTGRCTAWRRSHSSP